MLQEAFSWDFRARLRRFPGPVLVLNGARDRIFRSSERRFVAVAARGRLELLAHAGHLSNLEQPEAFTRIVRDFARDIGW